MLIDYEVHEKTLDLSFLLLVGVKKQFGNTWKLYQHYISCVSLASFKLCVTNAFYYAVTTSSLSYHKLKLTRDLCRDKLVNVDSDTSVRENFGLNF